MSANRFPLCWSDECYRLNWPPNQSLPNVYSVWWHSEHEHYQAHGPNDWESVVTVNRYQARRWAIAHAGAGW